MKLADVLVITTCPTIIPDGLGYGAENLELEEVEYGVFGRDVVMAAKISRK